MSVPPTQGPQRRLKRRKNRRKVSAKIAVATALVGSMNAAPAADYYLKLGDIKGEVQQAGLEGTIELDSFSFGASVVINANGSSQVPRYRSIRVVKEVDKSSPLILQQSTTGTPVAASLSGYRPSATGENFKFVQLDLEGVRVDAFGLGLEEDPNANTAGINTFSLKFNAGCVTTYEEDVRRGGVSRESQVCFNEANATVD